MSKCVKVKDFLLEYHQIKCQNVLFTKNLVDCLAFKRESNHKQSTSTKVLSYKKLTTFTQSTIKIHTKALATLTIIFSSDLSTNLQVVDDIFFSPF